MGNGATRAPPPESQRFAAMTQKVSRRRKALAILASCAVVGVGGAYTLAAWNDSEFLTADFASGSFNLEGSTDGTAYIDHDTAPAAAEVFTLTTDNMVPEQVVYDSFSVRLDADTTVSGTLAQPDAASATGTAIDDYSYVVVALAAGATCDAAGIAGGTVLGSADTLGGTNTAAANNVALVAGADAVAGTPVELCIEVTASPTLAQGASASATWQFVATSNDAS